MDNRIYSSIVAVLMGTATLSAQGVVPPYSNTFSSSLGDMKVKNTEEGSPSFIFSSYGGNSYGGGVTYTGNANYGADDYLITPALEVEEGKVYTISFLCKNGASGTPYKVSILKGNTEEQFDEVVMEPTEIPQAYSFASYKCVYEAKASGTIYFALRIEREAGTGTIAFDDFSVSAGVSTKAPGIVTNFTATPKVEDNAFVIALDGTAPTITHMGAELEGNVTITVKRSDGITVANKENVKPGENISLTDKAPLSTYATYTVTATNDFGTSEIASTNVSPVFGTPTAVSNLSLANHENQIVLSWDAVTTPTNNTAIFIPSQVTYKIVRIAGKNKVTVADNLTTTSYKETYEMPTEGQDAVSYTVVAVYNGHSSTESQTPSILIGNAYTGEYAESFANYSYNTKTWVVEGNNTTVWMPTSSVYSPSCDPQDGDMGMLKCQNTGAKSVWIASPIINVSEMKNPRLDFYVYQDDNLSYTNAIQPMLRTDKGDQLLGENISLNGGEKGWNRYSFYIPQDIKSNDFQIVLNSLPGDYASICVDNITIKDILDNHLVLADMNMPESIKVGETISIQPVVANKGSKVASGYSVKLLLDGEELATITGDDIESEKQTTPTYEFRVTPAYAGKTLTFEAQLIYDANESTDDNTVSKSVLVSENDYPIPTNLTATNSEKGIKIEWMKPDIPTEGTQENVEEDFEAWDSYTTEGEKGWTFVNNNNTNVNGIDNHHANTSNAVMIADGVSGYTANSGTKVLAFSKPYSYRDTPDYWAISPEVIGGQDITFSVVDYSKYAYLYGSDEFSICYSTGSTDVKDFKPIGSTFTSKTLAWQEHTVSLPADATRFAIHVSKFSNDGLFFDDFKFIQGSKPLEFKNFNIYRNGELIGSSKETTYLDNAATENTKYTYNVSAVYDRGESLWSNNASVVTTNIDNISKGAPIYTTPGHIVIPANSHAKVQVFTTSGTVVYSSEASQQEQSISVVAGIYLVQVNGVTHKICVK